jgi:uncharacterized protein YkwD
MKRKIQIVLLGFIFLGVMVYHNNSQGSEPKPVPFKLKQENSNKKTPPKKLQQAVEEFLFEQSNQIREKKKLPTFAHNEILNKAARYHSEDMLQRNYFSHFSPEGKWVLDRIRKFKPGYDESCAENLHNIRSPQGLKDPEAIADQMMKDWMGSPEHRKNLVSKEYLLLGIGCASDGEEIFCTQVFSGPEM